MLKENTCASDYVLRRDCNKVKNLRKRQCCAPRVTLFQNDFEWIFKWFFYRGCVIITQHVSVNQPGELGSLKNTLSFIYFIIHGAQSKRKIWNSKTELHSCERYILKQTFVNFFSSNWKCDSFFQLKTEVATILSHTLLCIGWFYHSK